jgi:hypothetical protein
MPAGANKVSESLNTNTENLHETRAASPEVIDLPGSHGEPPTEQTDDPVLPPLPEADEPVCDEPVCDESIGDKPVGADGQTDLDESPYDDLDEAAAAHVEDFRKRTKPSLEPVDGEVLFAALVAVFNRFMILPEGAAETASLWVMHTYAIHACNQRFAVRLMITAPGANSGKTTGLELLTYLVRYPEPTSDITPASVFRLAVAKKVLLIDECDHSLPSRTTTRNPMVAMLNMGHKKTQAVVERVETIGKVRVVVSYQIFTPVAMAGIGDYGPNTIKSRSYVVKLKRKMAHEEIDEFVPDEHAPVMRELRSQIHRWVSDNRDAIRECRPDLDRDLFTNRARDNSATLLQIADVVGPVCAKRSRDAIKVMTRGDALDANEALLGDIATILTDPDVRVGEPPQRIGYDNAVFSADLCALLVEHFPHREIYAGFTQARLATMLRNFDIEPEPRCKRRGKQVLHYYRADAFTEWLIRYGFTDPSENIAGSDVAPTEGATEPPPPPPPLPDAATPLRDAYRTARHEEWGRGDKRKGDKLRAAVDAYVADGRIEASAVRFTCALFWIINARDGSRFYARTNGIDELEMLPIEEPGLTGDNANNVIVVNPTKTLPMTATDYPKVRALVNKAKKHVLTTPKPSGHVNG